MKERGITTTGADWWVHLFPVEAACYWYSVRHMRDWISSGTPVLTAAKSKDGTVSAKGYLVRKSAPFVRRVDVPKTMIECFDWESGTDRQKGLLWGEQVLDWMLTTGALRIPVFTTRRLNTRSEQITMGDFGVQFMLPQVCIVEVKTETVDSGNLFVQVAEGGHRVHQKKTIGGVVTEIHKVGDLEW